MKPLFGDMAEHTVGVQKEKLGLKRGDLSYEDYVKVVKSISALCRSMAGESISRKIEDGLIKILEDSKGAAGGR